MKYLALLLFAAAPAVTSLPAQERPSDTLLTVGRYLDYETVGEPKASPDGSQVIFTRRSVDKIKDTFESTLWIMNADGGKLRFLSKGSSPVWSRDGTRIAFLMEGEPGGNQLHIRYMDAEGSVTQVTRAMKPPANPSWSPDGRWIGRASCRERVS